MTDEEARDFIFQHVNSVWGNEVSSLMDGLPVDIRFQGKGISGNPIGFWSRVSIQTVEQNQVSFADEVTFGANKKRYETNGLVFVQVFAPFSYNGAYRKGLQICELVRDSFRKAGQSGSLWFINARINELADDGSNYRWNVVAEVCYDTIV